MAQLIYLCASHSVGPPVHAKEPPAPGFTPATGRGSKFRMSRNAAFFNNNGNGEVKNHLQAGLHTNMHHEKVWSTTIRITRTNKLARKLATTLYRLSWAVPSLRVRVECYRTEAACRWVQHNCRKYVFPIPLTIPHYRLSQSLHR